MAEDVVCFLDNNGLERIMILGHSMGGNTAM
jgi:pimeloyl-ACP methyl ester carboxylesterase